MIAIAEGKSNSVFTYVQIKVCDPIPGDVVRKFSFESARCAGYEYIEILHPRLRD